MKNLVALFCSFVVTATWAQVAKMPPTPDQLYGQLFKDVQIQKVFPDGKSFVDAIPKRKVADILYDYGMLKGPGFDLGKFVQDNFSLPATPQLNYIQQEKNLQQHVVNLWSVLTRSADFQLKTGDLKNPIAVGNSAIPLPYPYVVPGGRFREMYYWDSYFTMLGLKASGNVQAVEDMVKNFAYLINTYGHIPNGTRTYYLSRSQPPFFALMVEMLASIKGKQIYKEYLPALKKEYDYWMEGASDLRKEAAFKRVVKLADGSLLNRYWDEALTPRPESFVEDIATADQAVNELAMRIRVASPEQLKKMLDAARVEAYQNLRAGAASGWDFSSRWMLNQTDLSATKTTQII
ncbi:MAG: alpha,alpha-trehalase TreF, partial [Bacteroidota bacterium]